ncbi:MAG: RES domain-containing protein [Sphingobium sp.]|nr:RES domain-containing protein [Sphingobium sp.]
MKLISGRFFRILFDRDEAFILRGAAAPEGRYHHDGQKALYMSPDAGWAWNAAKVHARSGNQAPFVQQLIVQRAYVVDIRDAAACDMLGISSADSDVPWQPQLLTGQRPSTWNISDKARAVGADGLIYTARTAPYRWHLVLFRWNQDGDPAVMARQLSAYSPPAS